MSGNDRTTTLSTRQQRAVAALLLSRSIVDAASIADVSERTLRRWLADPTFQGALLASEQDAIERAVRRLAGLTDAALDALQACLADVGIQPTLRIRASEVVFDNLLKLRSVRDTDARLRALEEVIRDVKPGH